MKQRFTSRQTSINSTKAPAVYSMKRAVEAMTGLERCPVWSFDSSNTEKINFYPKSIDK